MSKKLVIIGAGASGREALDIIEACIRAGEQFQVVGFVVDYRYGSKGQKVNGCDFEIVGDLDWLARQGELEAICAIGYPHLRMRVVDRALRLGTKFTTIIHPSATLTRSSCIGRGVIVPAGCMLSNRVVLGDHVHLNLSCSVSHDVVLRDFSTLAPGVHISGRVEVGQGAYLGVGACVSNNVRVGEWSIVGAGSAIIHDVESNTTVVGVPGRLIKTRPGGWQFEEDVNLGLV